MNEEGLLKAINIEGIRNAVQALGVSFDRRVIHDLKMGSFVPGAQYAMARRVLAKPEDKLSLFDKLYLWYNRRDLPSRRDIEEMVIGSYDINRMIPLDAAFGDGVGPHQIGSLEIERGPIASRKGRHFSEQLVLRLNQELFVTPINIIPPMLIVAGYNEDGKGEITREDWLPGYDGHNERANLKAYIPDSALFKEEVIRQGLRK